MNTPQKPKCEAAVALGRLNKGKPRHYSAEELAKRTQRLRDMADAKRWPKPEFEVGWSYPSSPNAVNLGFAEDGCWTVSKRTNPLKSWDALKGFKEKSEAEAYLTSLTKTTL